jgi:chemotaxis protein histidine kinase CheA
MTDEPTPSATVKIFQPDNNLKKKLGHGGFDTRNIEKAEQRLLAARTEFPSIARRELHMINASLLALYDPAHLLKEIFAAAVDLKANGGLFSYDVISAIADSLMDFTENLTEPNVNSLMIMQLHYDALQLVFEQGHDAMTVEQRDEMLDGLRKAVDKFRQNPAA